MLIVAVNWQIYIITGSAVALGVIGLARFIPIVIFSLLGGSFADVHNRKTIQIFSQIGVGILAAILAFTTIMGTVNPVIIYVVTILSAICTSFNMPSRQAFVPNLVDREHLPSAMSLNFIMMQTSMIVGPAIGGYLIGITGIGSVYIISTISVIAVILSIALIKTSGEPINTGIKAKVSIGAMIEGLKFVRSKTMIWSTMILDFFSTLFASATVILPIFAVQVLDVGPQGLGLLYAAPSVGAVTAGFLMANMGTLKRQGMILLVSVAVFAFATLGFGLSKNFTLSLVFLAFVGAGDSVSSIIRNVIRQLETPDYIRGRMTSINMIFFMGGPQLGEFEAGLLAAALGGPASVVIGGIGTLIVVGLVTVFIPAVRHYQNHEHRQEA